MSAVMMATEVVERRFWPKELPTKKKTNYGGGNDDGLGTASTATLMAEMKLRFPGMDIVLPGQHKPRQDNYMIIHKIDLSKLEDPDLWGATWTGPDPSYQRNYELCLFVNHLPESDEERWNQALEAVTGLSAAFERYARDVDDGLEATAAYNSATTIRVSVNAANFKMDKLQFGAFQHSWLPMEFNGWFCGALGKDVMFKRDEWRVSVSKNYFHLLTNFKAFYSSASLKRKATEAPTTAPATIARIESTARTQGARTRARR
uniref:Uncharacterized protein n=1 Tax=Trichuris muris TaxID=70415 RepID=A0A5S6QIX1_TRIMR